MAKTRRKAEKASRDKKPRVYFTFFRPYSPNLATAKEAAIVGILARYVRNDLNRRKTHPGYPFNTRVAYKPKEDIEENQLGVTNKPRVEGLIEMVQLVFRYCNGRVLSERLPGYFFANVSDLEEFGQLPKRTRDSLREEVERHYRSHDSLDLLIFGVKSSARR